MLRMKDGDTPLASCGSLTIVSEVVELLNAKGADVNAKEWGGDTPLDWADEETADLLRKHGGKTGEELPLATLHEALIRDDLQGVKDLLAKGADVNAKCETHGTPLDFAIKLKRTKIADLLRKHGGKTGAELKAEGK